MKRLVWGMLFLALAACGGDDDDASKTSRRIVKPGSLLSGPVGGSERFTFQDDSRVNFIVSGHMAFRTPSGVFLGTAFPAEVTFSVRSVTGATITGSVDFPRLVISEGGAFQGDVSTGTTSASVVGMFQAVTGTAVLDIQAFSYSLPVTQAEISDRSVLLQGSILRERDVDRQP
jgi:hypothetical protein